MRSLLRKISYASLPVIMFSSALFSGSSYALCDIPKYEFANADRLYVTQIDKKAKRGEEYTKGHITLNLKTNEPSNVKMPTEGNFSVMYTWYWDRNKDGIADMILEQGKPFDLNDTLEIDTDFDGFIDIVYNLK